MNNSSCHRLRRFSQIFDTDLIFVTLREPQSDKRLNLCEFVQFVALLFSLFPIFCNIDLKQYICAGNIYL